jgi:hypothetical protein
LTRKIYKKTAERGKRTPRSGEKLETKNIVHRALAKIEFACKRKEEGRDLTTEDTEDTEGI